MPKRTAKKDAAIDAVTVTPAAGTAPSGAYLAALVKVNNKTSGITNADRVALLDGDEVTYTSYKRLRLSVADFAALAAGSVAGKRKRTFPAADKLFDIIDAGNGKEDIISWAVCDHLSNPLSTSFMFCVDAEFLQSIPEGGQPKVIANSLSYEE